MALSDCPNCWETPCRCGHAHQGEGLVREKPSVSITDVVELMAVATWRAEYGSSVHNAALVKRWGALSNEVRDSYRDRARHLYRLLVEKPK